MKIGRIRKFVLNIARKASKIGIKMNQARSIRGNDHHHESVSPVVDGFESRFVDDGRFVRKQAMRARQARLHHL
ncbi:hypothetical protein [Burkholderia sp. BCC0405]|uniref:hypothetical protein n=1 Tax=Burkholderia sp. BCC0405 TaxID=2676298 RepID=UPI001FC811BB|nr:hypothetical protein [Burkholderia sp. BCC0405]